MANPFDDTAKTRYRTYFEKRGIRAIPQYEVFSLSRATDLVVECTDVDIQTLQDTAFAHFRQINALEFKGIHDPLTAADLNVIMLRAWGIGAFDKNKKTKNQEASQRLTFLSAKEIAEIPHQRTVTIICVTRPQRVLDTLQAAFGFKPTDEPGVYCDNAQKIPTWIIHPTELALTPSNYVLLPLARGKKLEQFIELCLAQGLVEYLQLTLDIGLVSEPDVIWQKMMEVFGMTLTVREDTWPYIDEFFRNVPEAMQKVSTIQEAMEEALEEREHQVQRRMLIRFLQHKFGDIPANVMQQIIRTSDSHLLEEWMDQGIDANSLADINFGLISASE